MNKVQPLVIRLYYDPKLYELARLVGYQGLELNTEAQQKLEALAKQYGRPAMEAAAAEIVVVDTAMKPPFARLRPEVVGLCWQLLGPPPGHPDHKPKEPDPAGPALLLQPSPEPAPEVKPKKRTKK